MISNLLPGRLPDIDHREPVTMPAPDLASATFLHQHPAHPQPPRASPPPAGRSARPAPAARPGDSPPAARSTASPAPPGVPKSGALPAFTVHGTSPSARSPACSRLASSASRSRPSLPIIGVLASSVQRHLHCDNPTEGVWSNLKRSLASLVKQDIGQLTTLVKTRLRRMQYRPGLLEGFLAKPGLDLGNFHN